jgi:diguanylate cyclase (GGDEF)-like protein/PAS domain S-box-containing protein
MNAVHHKTGLTRLPLLATAFAALVCVAILGMSSWREWAARAIVLKTAEVETSNLARSMMQHAEDSFDLMDASILGVVIRLEAQGTGSEELSNLQKVLVARKASLTRIRGLFISDENGHRIGSSYGAGGADLSDREYFRHHQESPAHEVFIGPPIKSRSGDDWMTTVSRRYNHPDGSFAGVVVATIGAEYFSEFYRRFDLGAIVLLGADGIVKARSLDNDAFVGRDTSKAPLFQDPSLQSSHGVYYFKSPSDGMQRVSSYWRSDRFPIVILATMRQDELLAPWRHAAITRMMLVFVPISLIAVIGFYLVRQLLRGQRMAAALAAKEANFRLLAEGSSDMVTRIGLDERVHYASPSSIRIVGWRPEQLVGTPALAGVNPLDLPRVQQTVAALKRGEAEEARIAYRTRHRAKSEIWLESTLRVTRRVSGEIDGVVAISRDMTQQKDLEGKLAILAIEDGLTGLANRRRFDERLLEEWGRAYRERTCLALLMIDLDHFKAYNDKYGHLAGDECLRLVARVLAAEAQRTTDLAARYGGEEFVMLLPNTDAAGCARIGERIRWALQEACMPHALNLPSGLVTASIGGAICRPGTERSAGHVSLVEAADRALYAAKDAGRDRLVMAGESVTLLPVAVAAR